MCSYYWDYFNFLIEININENENRYIYIIKNLILLKFYIKFNHYKLILLIFNVIIYIIILYEL